MTKFTEQRIRESVSAVLVSADVNAKQITAAIGCSLTKAYAVLKGDAGAELSFCETINLLRNLPAVTDELLQIVADHCGRSVVFGEPVDDAELDQDGDGRVTHADLVKASACSGGRIQQDEAEAAIEAVADRLITPEERDALMRLANADARNVGILKGILNRLCRRVPATA